MYHLVPIAAVMSIPLSVIMIFHNLFGRSKKARKGIEEQVLTKAFALYLVAPQNELPAAYAEASVVGMELRIVRHEKTPEGKGYRSDDLLHLHVLSMNDEGKGTFRHIVHDDDPHDRPLDQLPGLIADKLKRINLPLFLKVA